MRKLIQGSRMLKHPFESLHEDNGEEKMKKNCAYSCYLINLVTYCS